MRRASSPLRDEVRPQKRFCPPRTRPPHSNLSQPPLEVWCAERVYPRFSSVRQLGDAFVSPPLQPVLSPPAGRVLGDTVGSLLQRSDPVPASRQTSTSLSVNPSKDAEGSPSWWRVPLLQGLLNTPSQVCLPLHDTLLPLSHFIHEWERLPGVSLWVLRTIRSGYTLQFGKNPPCFDGVQLTVVNNASKASVLQQELSSLLQKGAIEEIPQSDIERGFFSSYFLVPKRDGGLRPILDLRRLNFSLYKGKFKMLTMKTIMSQIQGGNWFVTIDLKDAYFHIQVVQRHQEVPSIRLWREGLPIQGPSLRSGLGAKNIHKMHGCCIGLRIVLRHINYLGLRMNAKKSVLLPSQRTLFLGVCLDNNSDAGPIGSCPDIQFYSMSGPL